MYSKWWLVPLSDFYFSSFFQKYTPEIHGDKYNLLKAISVMTDVANAINEFKRRKDLGECVKCIPLQVKAHLVMRFTLRKKENNCREKLFAPPIELGYSHAIGSKEC